MGKYSHDKSLYPKDLVLRAKVDSRLHFDSGHLFARLRFLFEPVLYYKSASMPEDRIKNIQVAWDIMERFLANSPFVCGHRITIADFCLVATASSLTEIVPLDPHKHSKIIQWINLLGTLPYYEQANGKAAREFQANFRALLQANAQT